MIKRGRNTDYTPELLDKAYTYLDKWEDLKHAFPSAIGLASFLNIAKTTMYRWAQEQDKQAFKDILEDIKAEQHRVAWYNGLNNVYNSNLCKLLLGKHGYRDNLDIGSDPERPVRKEVDLNLASETVKNILDDEDD